MSIIEKLVKPQHRWQIYSIYHKLATLNPHEMAKRIDDAIYNWRKHESNRAAAKLLQFVSRGKIKAFEAVSHAPYLPGRTFLAPEMKDQLLRRFTDELKMLTAQDWLPRHLQYILKAAWESILVDAADLKLPYLSVEKGLQAVLQAAFRDRDIDVYSSRKDQLRTQIFRRLDETRRMINEAPDSLAKALELALRGNNFGRVETNNVLLDGPIIVERALNEPFSYYVDHTDSVLAKLRRGPLDIIYILDNAGESIWDLLLVERLLADGHSVTLAGKSRPVINDETYYEINEIVAQHGFSHEKLKVVCGYDIPGIDLGVEVKDWSFMQADLAILKGEGNFEGMPPDHGYTFLDILYILKVKTSGLDHRLRADDPEPAKGQGVIYLKPALGKN